METGKKYWRWGWWAIIGLVAILILIGLVIAAIATRNMKNGAETADVVETTVQTEDTEKKESAKSEKSDSSKKTENDSQKKESSKNKSSTSSKSSKKQESAVVTRCKSKAYMEKTLKGSTTLDCNSAEGIEEFKKSEQSGSSIPNSSAGPEVNAGEVASSEELPKTGPEDLLPMFGVVATGAYVGLTAMGARKSHRRS